MNEQSPAAIAKSKHAIPVHSEGPLAWLRSEIDRAFNDFPFARANRPAFSFSGFPAEIGPAMELIEKDGGYLMTIEVPGIDRKDVEVELAEGTLTVSGEKREETETTEADYLVRERSYGAFRRQLSLPPDVDPESLKATMHNGVLKLEMTKDEQATAKTRKIPVS